MKRIIAVILSAFMLVVALTACDESVGTSEDVSEPSASSTSEPESSYIESSDVDNSFSESSTDETSNDAPEIKLDLEPNSDDTVLVLSDTTVESDLVLYSKYGENHYVTDYFDGVYGTLRVTDGVATAFYLNASNVYEYNGSVYGIVSEGESYMELERYYCRFNDDGSYEKLFDIWKVFYSNDKVYFFEQDADNEYKSNLCCANIDGSDKKIITSEESLGQADWSRIFFYNDYVICTSAGVFCSISPDGKINRIGGAGDSSYYQIEFVNNGYLYYETYTNERVGLGSIVDRVVKYTLWRTPLNGGKKEVLVTETIKGRFNGFDAAAFGEKLLVFLPDGVYVYTDNFKDNEFYNYAGYKYDDIEQIAVIGDLLSVSLLTGKTLVYDTAGNVVFNSRDIQDIPQKAPEKNIIANPLLFWDTTDYRPDQAYIIGAFNKDGFHTTREFPYNDRHLNDYIEEVDGETVETNIIDTSKTLRFYDRYGSFFEADCGKIRCYSETIISEAHICADVKSDIPIDSQRFLGTYNGVDIFPESIEYSGNSITVDLDCDGDNEVVEWQFEDAYGEYSGGDYYHYSLTAVIDGKTVGISDNYDWLPLEKGDFEVFIADVDMDGKFEIIVYEKATSMFSDVYIYDVSAKGTELAYVYTISPMP